jgi:hypothetical protein
VAWCRDRHTNTGAQGRLHQRAAAKLGRDAKFKSDRLLARRCAPAFIRLILTVQVCPTISNFNTELYSFIWLTTCMKFIDLSIVTTQVKHHIPGYLDMRGALGTATALV